MLCVGDSCIFILSSIPKGRNPLLTGPMNLHAIHYLTYENALRCSYSYTTHAPPIHCHWTGFQMTWHYVLLGVHILKAYIGLQWVLFNLGRVNQWFQYNNLNVFLGFFVMWVILLFILIYYLNSLWFRARHWRCRWGIYCLWVFIKVFLCLYSENVMFVLNRGKVHSEMCQLALHQPVYVHGKCVQLWRQ